MHFTKVQLERYADVLIWGISKGKKKPFRPYDTLMIIYDLPALPLLETLHKKLLERRMNVVTRAAMNPSLEYNFLNASDKRQRAFIAPGDRELYAGLNGYIFLHSPASLTHLKNIDPSAINDMLITRKKLRAILNQREAAGLFNWTLCTFPTDALAKQARATLKEYAAQIIRACHLNAVDPVRKWEEIYGRANEVKAWLNSLPVKTLTVQGPSMELELSFGEKRRFVGVSGRNIPSFEIFTSPDWRGTRGNYYADMPSFRNGNYVEGVRLWFERGRVAAASSKKSEAFLLKVLAMDRGASQVGEFSLTDKRFSRINRFMADTLFDENYGGDHGNCHIALGSAYDNTYRGNPARLDKKAKKALGYNDSALHWDLINTENKTVTARLKNGKKTLIYEKGMFRY